MTEQPPTLKVLIVDDSQAAYQLIVDLLALSRDYRFYITWVTNCEQGIEKILLNEFDVCLVDYEMGECTGLDLIHAVTANGNLTPLILLTGYGSQQVDIEAMKAGAVDYLDKTLLRPDALERSIRYAVERARILKAEHEQRSLAQALLATSTALNSSLQFDEVLEHILTNVGMVIPHDTANIMLVRDDHTQVVGCRGHQSHKDIQALYQTRFNIHTSAVYQAMVKTHAPLVISDVTDFYGWQSPEGVDHIRSYLGAPILMGEQVIGFINLDSFIPGFFNDIHAQRLQLFAVQAALAIQNAFAYQRAQSMAAEEERQRLARDLHDAVSQTLFSASVIAETLPRLKDSAEVMQGLQNLSKLTKGALAEMRTLLVELRPAALLNTDLNTLLRQLVNGFQSRSDTEILLDIVGEYRPMPEETHVSLYRIAQESINNVIKHARASQVRLCVEYMPQEIVLRVIDDGRGFDVVSKLPQSRMGLRIMHERAETAGIVLDLNSVPGEGTIVEARYADYERGN